MNKYILIKYVKNWKIITILHRNLRNANLTYNNIILSIMIFIQINII